MKKIETVNKKSKMVPFILIIITIILIMIPIIFKILLMNVSNEIDNLPEAARTDQSAGGFVMVFFYFAIATLGMWSLVINLVIVAIIWIIYFIKRKKSKKSCVIENNNCE